MKKMIIIAISMATILIISLATLVILYKKNKLTIIPIKSEIEVFEEITLKDIISEDINIIENYSIDTNKIVIKQLNIKYKNKIFIYKDTININIIDTEPPLLLVTNKRIEEKQEIDLVNTFICADNYDSRPNCYIEGEYDINTPGEYKLKYIAIDSSNNKIEKDFMLNIYKKVEQANNPEPQKESYVKFEDVIKTHKNEHTSIGIDVSKWQGNIDFEAVKNAGCEFVIIKAGGTYKDGTLYTDPKFKENIESALNNNLKVGIYISSASKTIGKTKEEIEFILDLIKDYNVEYIAYDWENFKDFNSYSISLHELNLMAKTFLEKAKQNGYKTLLYGSKYYLENIWNINDDKWVAQYTNTNTYNGKYTMWQICNDGKIDGINTYVDIDIMFE